MKSIKNTYSSYFIAFMLAIMVLTTVGIKTFVSPKLVESSENIIHKSLQKVAENVFSRLNKVEAQQKNITQVIPELSSEQIDALLPALVDQYGDSNVFGGGIWPLPDQREEGIRKFSSFVHRDNNNQLIRSDYWNTAAAPNYFEQSWHRAGQNAPKGSCAWAPAYKDSASPEARTNCSMGIYKDGRLYGAATIDVTLGFFNQLAQDLEQEFGGYILVIEQDGKILNNTAATSGDLLLKTTASLASRSAFINAVNGNLNNQNNSHYISYTADNGEEYALYFQPLTGTPWSIALAVPVASLHENESVILSLIAAIQLPLMLAIICFCYITFQRLSQRLIILRENIDLLSQGNADLTTRVEIKANDEVGDIGHSVNNFINYLHTLMLSVNNSSVKISDSLIQVEEQTKLTHNIILGHAKETEQAVTAMEEMSTTANIVATNAAEAAAATQQVHDSVSQSKLTVARASDNVQTLLDDVEDTVVNIESMAQHTQQISAVLTVIGEIAEQTNLLALNAAIEAARAGEQGRGFAVVADEVRALAARTQNSTSEINAMLTKLNSGVKAVVSAMDKTKERCITTATDTQEVNQDLNSMEVAIATISELTIQIASAAEEQSTVSAEVTRNMSEIQLIVNELSNNAEHTTTTTQELSTMNTELKEVVNKFNL
ncbi:methyl-accepting chemotaxis protein [Moritella sp.]|uniref:methyl-accepting chemotaxis protein n=1 Tax=Moritella sp. TaxID=78556 RepID=UPI001E13B39C|nr:methyl-accepting chemotaxis protein [Moritella sp.]MCJ8349433.1 methyl-accepting chemotaxis protein [Moritella sp.]NQZ39251.1 methyl-accepting chemotaxis protein [Moritella sp.]